MSGPGVFYTDLAYVFSAALVGGLVARKFRQPLILGYVVGGIVIGPFTPGPTLEDTKTLELIAEIGVILLMYSIGIEFSFKELLKIKWVGGVGAPLSVVLCVAMGVVTALMMGWPVTQGIALGAIISVASTMVLSRLLIDRGELHSPHGRVMLGVTLIEDVLVVALTIALPVLNNLSAHGLMTIGLSVGKGLLLMVPIIFISAKLMPYVFARVFTTKSDELFILVAIAVGFATAALTQAVGLSLALGAFLGGMIVSGSPYAHETLTRVLPLRDVFVAIFFVTIGALIDPSTLLSHPAMLLAILAMIVLGKLVIWTLLVRLFRFPWYTAILVGVGLTQIGEFSYVLVQVARDAGVVAAPVYNATLAASLISIVLNVALIRSAPKVLQRFGIRQITAAA